jgi:hypothetical protein
VARGERRYVRDDQERLIGDLRLQMVDCRLQITDCGLQT